jgi:predicted metalloendopeptidase
VKAYFPESTRRDITQMVGHIKDEFALRLRGNRWLDEPTRKAALEKLGKLDVAVGYPDKWIDFSAWRSSPTTTSATSGVSTVSCSARAGQARQPVVIERFDDPSVARHRSP